MGEAYVIGHQGDNNLTNRENAATCLKHFIGKNKFRYILLVFGIFFGVVIFTIILGLIPFLVNNASNYKIF
jgi:hypothetical protein